MESKFFVAIEWDLAFCAATHRSDADISEALERTRGQEAHQRFSEFTSILRLSADAAARQCLHQWISATGSDAACDAFVSSVMKKLRIRI
jgi:hypothetical protein